ncbi:ribosomal RNA small subunit methyltransferase A [Candidatus Dependentiae bacterium]|nr:ribosomal RNA small subunit methyltransferase A [Candidatus Dependentiae bacterium]MCC7414555.1 ribosomal RNA small subunit methyltransferase A [Campylobacterota bacterium]
MSRTFSHGIEIKKRYGQHFLRSTKIVDSIVDTIDIESASVFEIGCGDGFLTRAILEKAVKRLWVFEIDPEWVKHVTSTVPDARLTVYEENILDIDAQKLASHAPWVLLANLPYQVTFPILHFLQRNRHLLREGIIMIQEEVAEKILKTSGRGYGYPSLFFQRYFAWKKLDKVPPTAFEPPPKVMSRLLYFKPQEQVAEIAHEVEFWKFIKICFHQPRRTLRNNLLQSHYQVSALTEQELNLRAQQMSMQDLIQIWNKLVPFIVVHLAA